MDYVQLDNPPPQKKHAGRFWYHVFLHAFSILLAATVVALFPAFHYWQWSLPTTYSLKTTQQYVNFVVVALALLVSWLLSHCLAITNDAEATAEFETHTFSLARLQTRSAAAGKDVVDMLRLATHNRCLWSVAGPFAVALTAFSAMAWVLSLLFVIEAQLVASHEFSSLNVTLGRDVPSLPDACRSSLTAAGCTYDLATSALASQLITHTSFSFENITFSGPEGTRALPVGAMQYFAQQAARSKFTSERSQYCLPIMTPNIVSCTAVTDDSRARYIYMNSTYDKFLQIYYDSYQVIANPDTEYEQLYVLTSSNGDGGVMAVAHSNIPDEESLSILTGSGMYASLLSQLATGQNMTVTKETYNETRFTAICSQPSDKTTYSWEWVNFTMSGGVMTANATGDICAENSDPMPMVWLPYAMELAAASTQLRDGYSKLFNQDYLVTSGPDYDRMQALQVSPLEYILDHVVGIVSTAWTATNAKLANHTTVQARTFDHRYVVTVDIHGPTILALCVASLILLCAILQAIRWAQAEIALREQQRSNRGPKWDLLDPLQLLAYGSVAAEGVSKLRLSSEEKRFEMMKDKTAPTLGFGPGTLMPGISAGGISSGYELRMFSPGPSPAILTRSVPSPPRPSQRHGRTSSQAELIRHSDDDFPGWDELQDSQAKSTPDLNGMRPSILRPGSLRSERYF